MPESSRFFGIVIRVYFDDHEPPHFHAIYGDQEALMESSRLLFCAGAFRRGHSRLFPRITQVRHLRDYILELTFANGVRATVDFRSKVVDRGGVFAPLESIDYFRQVSMDPEIGTVV